MNKLIGMTKVALIGCTLASATTGCCLFGNNDCCEKTCCEKKACQACPKKTHGANTSMTLSAGTDGFSVGSESNLGSHGASGSVSTH